MSGETLGTPVEVKPRPRALLQTDSDGDPVVVGVFPYEHILRPGDNAHEGDWDVVVSEAEVIEDFEGLLVVGFGATTVRSARQWDPLSGEATKQAWASRILTVAVESEGFGTSAHVLYVPDGLDPIVERLVRSDLVPGFATQESRPLFATMSRQGRAVVEMGWYVQPFLVASDGSMLAGRLRRGDPSRGVDTGEIWILPAWVSKRREWVRAAWKVWAETYPGRIPSPPQWRDSKAWFTPEELTLDEELERVRTERDETVTRLEAVEADLQVRKEAAAVAAAKGSRRLLSADGDNLVEAVQAALTDLGFTAKNMDDVTEKGKRVEDLRVSDDGWEAIAEVKGYKRGAAAGDLIKITRFAGLYAMETGKQPDAQWYVVNGFRFDEPGSRPLPLQGSDEDVAVFAEDRGVIVSTVDLFRVWRDVMTGKRDKDEVRAAMKVAVGRFTGEVDGK